MSKQMTLEQVRDECLKFAIQALSPSNRDWYNGVADAIDAHLNATKGGGSERTDLCPGVMCCAKCKFQVIRTNLYVASGTTGPGDSKTEPCPNGCGPLWPVTWKEYAHQLGDTVDKLWDELQAAKASQPTASPDVVRDAERYRWLRKHSVFANDSMRELWFDASLDRGETEQLDKQIDAAMAAVEGRE